MGSAVARLANQNQKKRGEIQLRGTHEWLLAWKSYVIYQHCKDWLYRDVFELLLQRIQASAILQFVILALEFEIPQVFMEISNQK